MKNDVRALLCLGKKRLKQQGIESYSLCTELLLMRASGLNRVKLLANPEHILNEEELKSFVDLLDRCAAHEPVQYILNRCEFMSLDFYVDRAVLIPRPDTEILVEEAITRFPQKAQALDIGTGSGCIAVSLARFREDLEITAVDISRDAIIIAEKNAATNGVRGKIDFILGDLREMGFNQKFDGIISNPPYIKTGDMQELDRNVRDYEPRLALDGGEDGLDFYRIIIDKATLWLKPGGMLLFETGALPDGGEQEAISGFFQGSGFSDIWTRKDLAGRNRVIGAILNRSV